MSGPVPVVEVIAKPWWESKTLWFNGFGLLVLLLGIFVDNYQAIGIDIPDQAAAWLAMAVLLGNGALRFQTTVPVAASRGKRVEVTGRVIDLRRE